MKPKSVGRWSCAIGMLCLGAWAGLRAAPPEGAAEPRFTVKNELLRPEGYREWVFIGATLGMSYSETPPREQRFHNLYLNPEAYQQYKRTGRFPEKTILVMEVLSAGSQASINRQGSFEDRFLGLEAAVKDSAHIRDGWGYFNFTRPGKDPAPAAAALPKQACWDCHHQHGETDNVFTQFYPVLRGGKIKTAGWVRTDAPER